MTHGPYNIKFVYLVGLHIYYKMTHSPYNIKLIRAITNDTVTLVNVYIAILYVQYQLYPF